MGSVLLPIIPVQLRDSHADLQSSQVSSTHCRNYFLRDNKCFITNKKNLISLLVHGSALGITAQRWTPLIVLLSFCIINNCIVTLQEIIWIAVFLTWYHRNPQNIVWKLVPAWIEPHELIAILQPSAVLWWRTCRAWRAPMAQPHHPAPKGHEWELGRDLREPSGLNQPEKQTEDIRHAQTPVILTLIWGTHGDSTTMRSKQSTSGSWEKKNAHMLQNQQEQIGVVCRTLSSPTGSSKRTDKKLQQFHRQNISVGSCPKPSHINAPPHKHTHGLHYLWGHPQTWNRKMRLHVCQHKDGWWSGNQTNTHRAELRGVDWCLYLVFPSQQWHSGQPGLQQVIITTLQKLR